MTKKHFERLARLLGHYAANQRLVDAVADLCRESNPRFDTARFLDAVQEARKDTPYKP